MKRILIKLEETLTADELSAIKSLRNNPDCLKAVAKILERKRNLFVEIGSVNSLDSGTEYAKLFGMCGGLLEAARTLHAIAEAKNEV